MDSKQIELLAANRVKDKIISTDRLRPYINENDKTPIWDGVVLLYKVDDHSNSNKHLKGPVDVQVKGELNSDHSKDKISYSIEVVDLNIYINNGGVIFFVVYINKDNPDSRKIYYEALTPVKIKGYLKGKETQDTLTIKLSELPANKKLIENIFFNFYENKSKQYSFRDRPLISLEELGKRKDIKSIRFECFDNINGNNSLNPTVFLFQNDICFYAEIEGSPILHPIDISNHNLVAVIQNSIASVKGEVYKDYLKIVQRKDGATLEFGKSVAIIFTEGSDRWDVAYTPTSMLSHRIKDLEFFINAIESEEIVLGNNEMIIPLSGLGSDSKLDIDSKKEELKQYHRIRHFLELLHITEDLDLMAVDKNSNWNELMTFVKGVVDKDPISFTVEDKMPFVLNFKEIGNLKILFSLKKAGSSDDLYYIGNYFDEEIILKVEINNTEYITSVYSALIPDNYNELSNLNLPMMLASYKPFLEWDTNIFEAANFDLLNLLWAYDKAESPKQIILDTAEEISKWILDESGDDVSYIVKLLNYLQVLKRKRALNCDEQNQLLDIIEDSNVDNMSKAAAHLLLDNQIAAERYLNKLDEAYKKALKSYPIYRFWINE